MKKYISPNTQAIHCHFENHLMIGSDPENLNNVPVEEPEFGDKASWDSANWSEE